MICGTTTRLRRIEREDIPTFVRWFSDPKVREFVLLNRPISIAEEERWFENQLQDSNSDLCHRDQRRHPYRQHWTARHQLDASTCRDGHRDRGEEILEPGLW